MKEHVHCSRTCSRPCSLTKTEQEHEQFLILRTRTEREQKALKSRTPLRIGKNNILPTHFQTDFRQDEMCLVYSRLSSYA